MDIYEKINELKDTTPLVVATIVSEEGSTPRTVGAKMLVTADGGTFETIGGGALEKHVVADALAFLRGEKEAGAGGTASVEYDLTPDERGGIGMYCGGRVKVFFEVLQPADTLLVLGGGHIALSLTKMVAQLPFRVVVVDDREEYARKERFPGAGAVHRLGYGDEELRGLVTSSTYVVIVTHAHAGDRTALENVLKAETRPRYVGMIGSRTKVKKVFADLVAGGVDQRSLDEVRAPIGLDIGGDGPDEIALSILAEVVAVKNGRTPKDSMKKRLE